jgi:hypothetical protein
MDSGSISAAAAVFAVIVVFSLLQRWAPYKPPSESNLPPYEELKRKFLKWEQLSLLPLFIFAGLFTIGWERLLSFFAGLSYASLGDSVFLYTPSPYYWWLPALFLGILTAAIPLTLLFKFLLGPDYGHYVLYGNLRVGFDSQKALRLMAVIIGPVALISSLLAMNCYTKFSDGEITINRFLGVGEIIYPYSRISAIKSVRYFKAPNGDIKERPYFSIEFDDGERWTTGDGLRDPDPETDRRLIEFVSGKRGKQLQEVDIE